MSAASRRLFFALWPDDPVRQVLFHWQTHNLPGTARWAHRADLHVTLHFLGQVEAARIEALRGLGAETAAGPFTLVLDEIGYWPRPQIVWAGPSSLPPALIALHERLGEGLRALGLPTEERRFRPHITLARKVRRPPETQPLQPCPWAVKELALVESRAGVQPMYHPIARWPLARV